MEDQSCKTPRWKLLKAQLNNLTPGQFQQKIADTNSPVIIDVRTEGEFKTGSIPGAVNINYLADAFWDEVEQLDAEACYFVFCRTGRRSIRACTLMRNGGFDPDRIYNLEGGYNQWLQDQEQ